MYKLATLEIAACDFVHLWSLFPTHEASMQKPKKSKIQKIQKKNSKNAVQDEAASSEADDFYNGDSDEVEVAGLPDSYYGGYGRCFRYGIPKVCSVPDYKGCVLQCASLCAIFLFLCSGKGD
jgi:hypothetical protein